MLALTGMAVASVAMGLLPTYAAFGVGATILLLAARVARGLSAGAEIGGAPVYVAEYAPPARGPGCRWSNSSRPTAVRQCERA